MINPSSAHPRCIEILTIHSQCVWRKAEALARASVFADAVDYVFLREAAMLHDYGIIGVDAPGIYCFGSAPYITHGILGAEYLRWLDPVCYARHARVCERHIGVGLSADEILESGLPLPAKDFLPETFEEKLITFADCFYSKNPEHLTGEKTLERVFGDAARFGDGALERVRGLHALICGG